MSRSLIASHPFTNTDSYLGRTATGSNALAGQSFPGANKMLDSIILQLYRSGSLGGTVKIGIYAHTGTYGSTGVPTGSALATSDAINASAIGTSAAKVTFTFTGANKYLLSSGTNYFWVLDMSAMTGTGQLYRGRDNSASVFSGNAVEFFANWSPAPEDLTFELYGTDHAFIDTGSVLSTSSTKSTIQANITNIGASTPTIRGFVLATSPKDKPLQGTSPSATEYQLSAQEVGSFSTGVFSLEVTGLEPLTTYYARAFVYNSGGYSYGDTEVSLTTINQTTVAFSSTDLTDIFKAALDSSSGRGGEIDYNGSSTDDTGVEISYTFKVATVLDVIRKIHEFAPSDWYWYIDIGSNVAYFKQRSTTPDHILEMGKHIMDVDIVLSIENVVNTVYFTGGDTGGGTNLFKQYQDAASLAEYGPRLDRRTDNRVTVESTANTYGQGVLAAEKDEKNQSQIQVTDANYDITLFRVGDTVKISGTGGWIENMLLQITRIDYTGEIAVLEVGSLPPRFTQAFEKLKKGLLAVETQDNPDSPS